MHFLTTLLASTALAAPLTLEPRTLTPAQYRHFALLHHNYHRANHSAPPLTWSTALASKASEEAHRCIFSPQGGDGGAYGQNLGFIGGTSGSNISTVVTALWYNPQEPQYTQYGAANPSGIAKWGDFSQIVWNATTEVGCGTATCTIKGLGEGRLTFCDYAPPGNVEGEYADNVLPPLGYPSIGPGYGTKG